MNTLLKEIDELCDYTQKMLGSMPTYEKEVEAAQKQMLPQQYTFTPPNAESEEWHADED